ncbi:hypothetical protein BGZ82_001598 [Podila clonocystis]|nr:hypothetical protein BGZ82_001598 [Podila clonocystis]
MAGQISTYDSDDDCGAETFSEAKELDDSDRDHDRDVKAEKDSDPRKSASLWMDTLATEGYFTFSDKMTAKYYAFSTPWQLEQALIYGDIVMLDIRKQVYGTTIIASWLKALTAHIKIKLDVVYAPKLVFASLSNIKFDALQTLFPEARALYCNFYTASHVQGKIQSLMKNAAKGDGQEAKVNTTEMMNEASRQFKEELMKEEDLVTATANLSRYRRRWKGYQFLQFLETDYFAEDKKRRWMYAHRQDISYGKVVSFDHCNSWHRSLTSHFDIDVSQIREDRVIQALARKTDRKFQKSIVGDGMTLSGHKSPSKDSNLRNSHAAKEINNAGHSSTLITRIDRNMIGVNSFKSVRASSGTSSPTVYKIIVDPNEHQIFSCSCRYFFLFRRPCKHIELVKMEDPMYTFEIKPAFVKPNLGTNSQPTPVLTQSVSATSLFEPTVQATTATETSPASRAPSSETVPVTHSAISSPYPDVVSPVSTSGSSGAALKRRIVVESPPEVEPAKPLQKILRLSSR